MKRTPEPELMDEAEQARAYAEADFEEPHEKFVDVFCLGFPDVDPRGTYLDLGCGPGDIAVRFARRFPDVSVHGIDGAKEMLTRGKAALRKEKLDSRVHLFHALLPTDSLPLDHYEGIISNSLLHHLHDPQVLWRAVKKFSEPGAPVFIMDLIRPESPERAEELVEEYSGSEPEVLQRDFYNSLLAAFRPDEVEAQLRSAGLPLTVQVISDRHLVVWGKMS